MNDTKHKMSESEEVFEREMAEDNTYFETLIAEERKENDEKIKEREDGDVKIEEFDTILDTLRDFFNTRDWQKDGKKWMVLYGSHFNFHADVNFNYSENNQYVLEACMGKLLEFSKGRTEEERRHIYRLFSYWMRIPFLLGKYENVVGNFLNMTQ